MIDFKNLIILCFFQIIFFIIDHNCFIGVGCSFSKYYKFIEHVKKQTAKGAVHKDKQEHKNSNLDTCNKIIK